MSTIQDATLYADLGLSRSLQDSSKSNELGQEDFLKLMTTQLKHQDPTKPADNAEFMSQLAQFGTVTGIEDLKTEIQNLAGSLVSNQTFQAAGMLGREVLIPATQGVLEQGGVIEGAVELSNAVSSLNIGIYDLTGQLVRNVSLGSQSSGMVAFDWDGLATDGEVVPPGRYEIRAEAISGGINEAYDVLIADKVQSVSLPAAGKPLTMELAGLGTVNFSEIRQIR
ncbi:MAG: flagellar hook assembly protein FlgD [Gammaproteobacteria bacterium]|nr:flagellar hook assembly protein FlgD [Gammaproteobacteria bacterium]